VAEPKMSEEMEENNKRKRKRKGLESDVYG
jgi:hypothetical protein